MKIVNTADSWGALAKFFHWLVAALIFTQFVLGWIATSWRMSPTKLELFVWHKSIGMLVLVMVLLRLIWRVTNPTPALPADTQAWERTAAQASHAALYLLMIAMPLAGWIINSAANIPFSIFWLIPLPAIVGPDKPLADLAAQVHLSIFIAMAVLIVVHVAAALRHHFVKRNNILARMLPALRRQK